MDFHDKNYGDDIMDYKGQLSLEYILLFMVFLIIFSTISIPILTTGMDDISDTRKVMETRTALLEISKNIKIVYSLSMDSKKTLAIYIPQNMTVRSNSYKNRYYLSSSVRLSDNTIKYVDVEVPCNVSFNGNINHYYTNLNNRWYYNTEVRWIESGDKKSINVKIK